MEGPSREAFGGTVVGAGRGSVVTVTRSPPHRQENKKSGEWGYDLIGHTSLASGLAQQPREVTGPQHHAQVASEWDRQQGSSQGTPSFLSTKGSMGLVRWHGMQTGVQSSEPIFKK